MAIRRAHYTIKFKLQSIFVWISIIYTILFPADKQNIKEILLFLALLICYPVIVQQVQKNFKLAFFSMVYPVITIVYAVVVGNSQIGNAISYGYVWIFLLLVPAVVYYEIDIKKPFIFATTVVATVINFIYLADILGLVSIYSNPIVVFLSNMNELQYGKGIGATFGYSIFYKSCPLIVFTYGYMLYKKKYLFAAYLFLSLVACGTRANFYVGVILTGAILVFCSEKPSKKMVAVVLVVMALFLIGPSIVERMTSLSLIKVNSDSIKSRAIESIFAHLNEHPYRYIFGSGVGSTFYSTGRNAYVDVVEVSYYDYFRQVGVVGFSVFISFLVAPLKWLAYREKWLLFAFVGFLATAYTNPLLVTSTSFIAYVMIYSTAFYESHVNLFEHNYNMMITDEKMR